MKHAKMNMEEVLSVISSIPKGVAGIFGFAAVTTEEALKKSRITKEPTPAHLQVITKKIKATVTMGTNYQDMVNKLREKDGEDPDFVSKPTYCFPVSENLLIWENKKSKQLYFRVYFGYQATFTQSIEYFDANGKEIPAEEYKKIKEEYLKASSTGEVTVRNYKVEGVTYVKRGEVWLDKREAV